MRAMRGIDWTSLTRVSIFRAGGDWRLTSAATVLAALACKRRPFLVEYRLAVVQAGAVSQESDPTRNSVILSTKAQPICPSANDEDPALPGRTRRVVVLCSGRQASRSGAQRRLSTRRTARWATMHYGSARRARHEGKRGGSTWSREDSDVLAHLSSRGSVTTPRGPLVDSETHLSRARPRASFRA